MDNTTLAHTLEFVATSFVALATLILLFWQNKIVNAQNKIFVEQNKIINRQLKLELYEKTLTL